MSEGIQLPMQLAAQLRLNPEQFERVRRPTPMLCWNSSPTAVWSRRLPPVAFAYRPAL